MGAPGLDFETWETSALNSNLRNHAAGYLAAFITSTDRAGLSIGRQS
jgi:hypothetical protein